MHHIMQQAPSNQLPIPGPPTVKIGRENSPRLVNLTVQQIIKDFGMYGYPIHYSGKPEDAYDELYKELKMVVEETIMDGYDQLLELLSKIGIQEKTLNDIISSKASLKLSETISALILEREFKKVCNKEVSSGNL